jgi:Uma2 family endonuclease
MSQTYTLSEYLNAEIEPDRLYEVEGGEIIDMPPESFQNVCIIFKLVKILLTQIEPERISNKAEIIVTGSRFNSRFPDLVVFTEEQLNELSNLNRSTITLDMLPPLLAVEVVSPGKKARNRDYRFKRSEYAARGIKYYWIIDPEEKSFIELKLIEGFYEEEKHLESFQIIEPFNLEIDLKQLFDS